MSDADRPRKLVIVGAGRHGRVALDLCIAAKPISSQTPSTSSTPTAVPFGRHSSS